ncbi:hypothetical protein PV392_29495 [Streptomyces sp. ME03-5709C]|nr:hypothetical protein [Streptomyces sp. ME03-5709C]
MSTPATQEAPALDSVLRHAAPRAKASSDPARYLRLVGYYTRALLAGETPEALSRDADGIEVAAEIEAEAGVRRVQCLTHPFTCGCCGCRIWTPTSYRSAR